MISKLLTLLTKGANTQKSENPIPITKALISYIKIIDLSTKDISEHAQTRRKDLLI